MPTDKKSIFQYARATDYNNSINNDNSFIETQYFKRTSESGVKTSKAAIVNTKKSATEIISKQRSDIDKQNEIKSFPLLTRVW